MTSDRCQMPEKYLPGEGWTCTREPGHEPPCAAVPPSEDYQGPHPNLVSQLLDDAILGPAMVSERYAEHEETERRLGEIDERHAGLAAQITADVAKLEHGAKRTRLTLGVAVAANVLLAVAQCLAFVRYSAAADALLDALHSLGSVLT